MTLIQNNHNYIFLDRFITHDLEFGNQLMHLCEKMKELNNTQMPINMID
jgi:ubiquinone biosynthesis protein COQ9